MSVFSNSAVGKKGIELYRGARSSNAQERWSPQPPWLPRWPNYPSPSVSDISICPASDSSH
jgi:hypothetical protein